MFANKFVLTLHRVGNQSPENLRPNENMKVSQDFLEKFINKSRKSGWNFVSIDEIKCAVSTSSNEKLMALTFDDGYADNYTEAYPVLSSYNVPFCIYLTTDFIGNQVSAWWFNLEQLLVNSSKINTPDGFSLTINDKKSKEEAFFYIRSKLMSSTKNVRKLFFEFIQSEIVNLNLVTQKPFMSWTEVISLAHDPLVTLGGHTISHPVLSGLPEGEVLYEMRESRNIIEQITGRAVKHFAYPFGGWSHIPNNHKNLLEMSGYETAVTTIYDEFTSKSDVSFIPRIMLVEDTSLSEIYRFLIKQKFKKILNF